jgi:hypothetical protein
MARKIEPLCGHCNCIKTSDNTRTVKNIHGKEYLYYICLSCDRIRIRRLFWKGKTIEELIGIMGKHIVCLEALKLELLLRVSGDIASDGNR